MKRYRALMTSFLALVASTAATQLSAQTLDLWQTDVCEKVFPDTPVGDQTSIQMRCAANEYESAQIGLRANAPLSDLTVKISDLRSENGDAVISAEKIRVRKVDALQLLHNTPGADPILTRKAPCDMPDILNDFSTLTVEPNVSQGLWITLHAPKGTAPGLYNGTLSIEGANFQKEAPVSLEIYPFELPEKPSLYMTNWWNPHSLASRAGVKSYSEEHWQILENYIRNMGEHRQNVLMCFWRPGEMVKGTIKKDGTMTFDYANFDRLLDLALKYGVLDRLELSSVGYINREDNKVVFTQAYFYDEAQEKNVALDHSVWLKPALTDLCRHLKEKGLFERAMIHIADEPFLDQIDDWRAKSQEVRAIEPELKQIEAIEGVNFDDRLDVWVPKLNHFDRWRSAYEERRDKGEFWYYICCHPVGQVYPNRFMDLPGARVRSLHWINYTENLVGYLHWGYNHWQGDPFGPPTEQYGPGDTHVVYPGEKSPIDSIRWEIQRESLEDYEYLKLLEDKTAALKASYPPEKVWFLDPKSRSTELARRVVPSLAQATSDYRVVNEARQAIVDEIKNLDGPARLAVRTYPEDCATIYQGPTVIEIVGVATPGAEVTINGKPISVSEDGIFAKDQFLSSGKQTLEFVAKIDGQIAKTTRTFYVREALPEMKE